MGLAASPDDLAGSRCCRVGDVPEVLEGVQPAIVAVRPDRLNGVTSDLRNPAKLERGRRQGAIRAFMQVAEHVAFSLTAGTRAGAAQGRQGNEALRSVSPTDCQFFANVLKVGRTHDHRVAGAAGRVHARLTANDEDLAKIERFAR